jgi:hypothetical protein
MKRWRPIYLIFFCVIVPSISLSQRSIAIDEMPVGTELSVEEVLGVKEHTLNLKLNGGITRATFFLKINGDSVTNSPFSVQH